MSNKTLYLVNQVNGITVNSSCHLPEMMKHIENISNIKTVQFNVNLKDMIPAIEEVNAKADILFLVHDFTLWNCGHFDYDFKNFQFFLQSLWNNKNVFVFPTEMASSGLIKSQFKENASMMTKIIVGSESFRKMFLKVDAGFAVPSNRIKYINMPTEEFGLADNTKLKTDWRIKERVLFTPGYIHPKKDYLRLLQDFKLLLRKHKSILYVLSFKSHPTISSEEAWAQFDALQDYVEANNLEKYVRLSLDRNTTAEYHSMLKLADLVLFPHDFSLDMYNGCMLDALAMGKAIVTPESVFAEDLVKKTSILLYRYQDEISFYDACSVVLENKDFRDILQQHNYEYGQTLAYSKIAQQYVNQIKRFKFN